VQTYDFSPGVVARQRKDLPASTTPGSNDSSWAVAIIRRYRPDVRPQFNQCAMRRGMGRTTATNRPTVG